MASFQHLFHKLYETSEKLHHHLHKIDHDMAHNPPQRLERLWELVSRRGEIMEQLNPFFTGESVQWSPAEKRMIEQMRKWEESFQPQLDRLYQAFSKQVKKLEQGKQAAHHYQGGYGFSTVHGGYVDQRK